MGHINHLQRLIAIVFFWISGMYGAHGEESEPHRQTMMIPDSLTKRFEETIHYDHLASGITYAQRVPESSSDITRISMILRLKPSELKKEDRILPSFIGSLLTKGSQKYSRKEVDELTEKYAIGLGCYPGFSCSTNYYAIGCTLTVDNEFLDLGLDLFTSIIQEPIFDEESYEVTKKNSKITVEKSCRTSDTRVLNLSLNKIFYNHDHPYFTTLNQLLAAIDLTTREKVMKTYKRALNGQRMRLTALSSQPPKTLVKKMNSMMNKVRDWYVPPVTTKPPQGASQNRVIMKYMDSKATSSDLVYLQLKAVLPGRHSSQAFGLSFLHHILADDLYENIRVTQGLSYAPQAYYSGGDFGLSTISASTPTAPKKILDIINKTINSLKYEKKDEQYINQKKPQILTRYYSSFISPRRILNKIESHLFHYGNLDLMLNYPKYMNELTGDDIQSLAIKYLKDYKLAIYGKKDSVAGININQLVIP